MEYIGKDGKEYYISVDSLYWIKGHADLLDEDVNKFLWAAVDEARSNFDIKSFHIFRFLIEHENFPELEPVLQINQGRITVPIKDLAEYFEGDDLEKILNFPSQPEIDIDSFEQAYCGNWNLLTTPDHRSFNSLYDSLIIIHRVSGLEMDTVLTWYLLTKYGYSDFISVEDIIKYCHKYADDPKLFKEV